MSLLGVHLGGSSEGLLEFGVEAARQGVRTFQVSLSNPRNWDPPKGDLVEAFVKEIKPIVRDSANPNINFVVHGPFGVSLSKSQQYRYIVRYFIEASKIMEGLSLSDKDTVRLVTHMGSRVEGVPLKEAVNQIHRLCASWDYYTSGHKSVLCLENDAGSKKGTKLGSVKFLKAVLNGMSDYPRIRMCWDTEHAYANGMDISDWTRVEDVLSYAGVVHLNSIPSYVSRGGHLDRHSDDLIKDGKYAEELIKIARRCKELSIPMILERSRSIVMEDFSYIMREV